MNRKEKLLTWIEKQHEGQLIKDTSEPYLNHLTEVARLASIIPLGYEIGLCHDLFEETKITESDLKSALTTFNYNQAEADIISIAVTELTDVFTKKDYPDLSKSVRKKMEAERLANISPAAQTVKYADLIYNIGWMLEHDRKHVKKYLKRKRLLIKYMKAGHTFLRDQVIQRIESALL